MLFPAVEFVLFAFWLTFAYTGRMALTPHTYGPSCSLHTESNPFTRRASVISEEPPKIRTQFFYGSNLPIDDPLSPIPPPSSGSTGPSKVPPQPFSVYDNAALESAWRDFTNVDEAEHSHKRQDKEKQKSSEQGSSEQNQASTFTKEVDDDANPEDGERTLPNIQKDENSSIDNLTHIFNGVRERNAERTERVKSKIPNPGSVASSPPVAPRTVEAENTSAQPHLMLCDDPNHIPFDHDMLITPEEVGAEEFESGRRKRRHRSPFHRRDKDDKNSDKEDEKVPSRRRFRSHPASVQANGQHGQSMVDRDTTGTPFLRAPSRDKRSLERRNRSQSEVTEPEIEQDDGMYAGSMGNRMGTHSSTHLGAAGSGGIGYDGGAEAIVSYICFNQSLASQQKRKHSKHHSNMSSSQASDSEGPPRPPTRQHHSSAIHKHDEQKEPRHACVLVGLSRLHLVEIPDLQMKPIYC